MHKIELLYIKVFGYGAIGSESCVSVELFGCPPSSLSYPINTPNLLQYRIPLPDNLNAASSGVEYGYLYGSKGVLNNGKCLVLIICKRMLHLSNKLMQVRLHA